MALHVYQFEFDSAMGDIKSQIMETVDRGLFFSHAEVWGSPGLGLLSQIQIVGSFWPLALPMIQDDCSTSSHHNHIPCRQQGQERHISLL